MLSIVTIVKQDLVGFQRTRKSLEQQSFSRWEHIVVPSFPADTSVEYAKALPGRRTTVVIQDGFGRYSAMNQGLALAAGEFVVFLNAGDELADEYSLEHVEKFLTGEKPKWAIFGGYVRGPSSQIRVRPLPGAQVRDIAFGRAGALHPSIYYHTKTLLELGGYDEGFKIAGDLEVNIRLTREHEPLIVDKPVSIFYTGGISTTKVLTTILESSRARTLSMERSWVFYAQNFVVVCCQIFRASLRRVFIFLLRLLASLTASKRTALDSNLKTKLRPMGKASTNRFWDGG